MNTAATASTARQWTLEIDADRVAWLTFDKPGASANSLSRAAMEELDERLREVEQQRPAGLVIRSGKTGFIAGADVSEFGQVREPSAAVPSIRAAHGVLQRLADLPFPTVAAINGYCLGGGRELAMGADLGAAAHAAEWPGLGAGHLLGTRRLRLARACR